MGGGVILGMGVSDAVYVCLQGERLGAWGFGPLCGVGGSGFVRFDFSEADGGLRGCGFGRG